MRFLGRSFQLVGLLLVLEALYYGIVLDSMGKEMSFLIVGGAVFYLGRMIEERGQ
ncbi:MAG: hypothetical protein GY800_00205 [Planctomycetes bacterium]|nr:hypothetical protein [Planctomycetota bacterium]